MSSHIKLGIVLKKHGVVLKKLQKKILYFSFYLLYLPCLLLNF